MEKQSLTLGTAEVYLGKLTSTPTPTYWSQIYNAGSLFAVLSLKYKEIPQDVISLSVIGKEVFNALEEEYFTLETKNFISIKDAIIKSLEKIPASIEAAYLIATIPPGKDNLVYVYVLGEGSIILKRGEKIGLLLHGDAELASASGGLEDKDILILLTDQFKKTIPLEKLTSSLDLPPGDIVEILGPKLHDQGDGGEAAIIIAYHQKQDQEEIILPEIAALSHQKPKEEEPHYTIHDYDENPKSKVPFLTTLLPKIKQYIPTIKIPSQIFSTHLTHTKKLILTVASILVVATLVSGYLAVTSQAETKNQAEADKILESAQKEFNQAEALVSLSKNLARDDFEKAKQILEEGSTKFSKGSKQQQQISAELTKVTAALASISDTAQVTAQEAGGNASPLLAGILKNSALYGTSDDAALYYLTPDTIISTDTSGKNQKTIVSKADWKKPAGLGVFGGNLYVLDKDQNQILKYASGAKSNYLPAGTTADFSQASALTIDGSIYVLSSTGTIAKFTKGKAESFNVSGLQKPFDNPSRIVTSAESTNIYVLDSKNSRVVALAKNGTYQSQYQSPLLKGASDIDVAQKQKKLYFISGSKIYEIPLQ